MDGDKNKNFENFKQRLLLLGWFNSDKRKKFEVSSIEAAG